jgi:hypothetical protein
LDTVSFPIAVCPAPLTITIHTTATERLYGTANPTFTNAVTGLIGSETVTVSDTIAATPSSPVGSYPVSATISGPDAAHYALTVDGFTLVILKAPLYISANNVAVTYGQTPPPITAYHLTGFVNGETASVVSGVRVLSTTVTSTTPVGFYLIGVQVGTLTAANYYFDTFSNGEGSVGVYRATLTIRPASFTIHAGDPIPAFTYTLDGFVNGQSQATATTGAATITTTANTPTKKGHYYIIGAQGTLQTQNYYFLGYISDYGILTVLP